jgi:hypothetical protein
VNLRGGASYGYPILEVLDQDSPLVLIGRDEGGGWFQAVTFTSPSLTGWVNADFVGPLFDSRLLAVTWKGPTAIAGVPCGVNIHPKNGEGDLPIPSDLQRAAWVRFPFMASPVHFPNLEAAFLFYDPVIAAYHQAGAQIILVLTHETYGEAAGWDWLNMRAGDWARFAPTFAGVAEKIATRYRGRVAAYEVWNEGDAQPGNEAAVAISPQDYAPLLNASAAAIRRADPGARIILGGLLDPSGGYLREVRRALGGRLPVDGVGIHPYGRGAPADPSVFARFGSLGEVIENYQAVAPGLPLWITEIGALGDNSPSRWGEATAYMQALVDYLRTAHSQRVEVLLWYGWSDGMHVSQRPNGLLGMDGRPKPPLYETFFRLCGG